MNRANGFYWVKHHDKWIIAEWIDDEWFPCGLNEPYLIDEDFEEINETRLLPPYQGRPDELKLFIEYSQTGLKQL